MKRKPRRGFSEDGFEVWGGYMAAKQAKLEAQFCETASTEKAERGLFHGIAIFVNGYTEPPADELKRIMMVHGGSYHHYMTSRTTHIIASNLPNVKIKKLKVMNVVKPEWIVESLKAGKLLDFRSFLLYSHQSRTQPRLQFTNSQTMASKSSKNTLMPNQGCNNAQEMLPTINSSLQETVDISTDLLKKIDTLPSDNGTWHSFKILTSFGSENVESSYTSVICLPSDSLKFSVLSSSSSDVLDSAHCENVADQTSKQSLITSCIDEISVHPVKTSLPSKPQQWTAKTAGEANFLSEFYNNSRLHHISTMGASFKQYVNELREKTDNNFEGKNRLREWKKRMEKTPSDEVDDNVEMDMGNANPLGEANDKVIMHIDMDCFFVSVGLRNRPDLRGQPVAVTHAKGGQKPQPRPGQNRKMEYDFYRQRLLEKRKMSTPQVDGQQVMEDSSWLDDNSSMAEIASCSYEARTAGLKNGMFLGKALTLCPNLKTIPYDFEGYKEVSYTLYDTVASYTLNIEAVSCDEMFVDCTELLNDTNVKPLEFASFIRQEIKDRTGCPASTGFGCNVLQARMATKRAKPDGQFHLRLSQVCEFMSDIKVEELPGVGRSMSYKLRGLSVTTCGDLQQLTLPKLRSEFGSKTGTTLYRHCRGEDDRKLSFDHVRKSVSAEVNYGIRFSTQTEADAFFRQLSTEVTTRLKEIGTKGRCITLKLMVRAKDAPTETAKFLGHGVCDHITKSVSLPRAIADSDTIFREVSAIYRQLRVSPSDLRGIGIQLSRLDTEVKPTAGGIQSFLTKLPQKNMNDSSLPSTKECQTSEKTEPKKTGGQRLRPRDNFLGKKSEAKLFEGNTIESSTAKEISKVHLSENQINPYQAAREESKIDVKSISDSDISCDITEEMRFQNKREKNIGHKQDEQSHENALFTEDNIDPEVFAALPQDIQKEILGALQVKNEESSIRITRQASQISLEKPRASTYYGYKSLEDPHSNKLVTSKKYEFHYDSQEPGPSNRKSPEPRPRYHTSQVPGCSKQESPEPSYPTPADSSSSSQNTLTQSQKSHDHQTNTFVAPKLNSHETQDFGSSIRRNRKQGVHRTRRERMTDQNSESTTSHYSGQSHKSDDSNKDFLTMDKLNFSQIEPSFLAALPTDVRQELETDLVRRKEERQKNTEFVRNTYHRPQSLQGIKCLDDEKGTSPGRRNKINSLDNQQSTNNTRMVMKEKQGNALEEEENPEQGFDPNLSVPETRALLKAWVRTESVPQPCDVAMLARHFQRLVANRKLETLDLGLKCLIRCVRETKCNDWEEALECIVNKMQNTMQIVYGGELKIPT